MRLFCFSFSVCLALRCALMIRLCLSGFVMFCTMSHISRMLTLSGFSGHVHVGHVYGFSLLFLGVLISVLEWSISFHSIDTLSRNVEVVSILLYVLLPNVLLGFFALYFLLASLFHALPDLLYFAPLYIF